jgi:hypothetical protein
MNTHLLHSPSRIAKPDPKYCGRAVPRSTRRILSVVILLVAFIFTREAVATPPVDCSGWGPWTIDYWQTPYIRLVPTPAEPMTAGHQVSRTIEVGGLNDGEAHRIGSCGQFGLLEGGDMLWLKAAEWQASPAYPQTSPDNGQISPLGFPYFHVGGTFTATFTPQESGVVSFTVTWTNMLGLPGHSVAATLDVPYTILQPMRLGYWKFDTTQWKGEEGQVPFATDNIDNPTDWNFGALKLNTGTSRLGYNAYQSDGMPDITRNEGTVRFWFKPNWNSGTGPGVSSACLLQMQTTSTTQWSLNLNAAGSQLTLSYPTSHTLSSSTLSWTAGGWHQIAVTYSGIATNVVIYVDGSAVTSTATSGVTWLSDVLSKFTIGSASDGSQSANGRFDELETFNYVLSASDISSNYSATILLDSDGDTISNLNELAATPNPTDPYNPDTDGDGYWDNVDQFPTDPNRWDHTHTGDSIAPVIQLLQPISAILQ